MRVFISSVIGGFEVFRAAAAEAAQALDYEVVRAEDFAASSDSPRVACLSGVRKADVVLVLLGARYGEIQSAGKSATHEEFEEAIRDKQVFVFVQSGVEPEQCQAEFIAQVRGWATGRFTGKFSTADEVRTRVTRALHRWQLDMATGQVDPGEMETRALERLPPEDRYHRSSSRAAVAVSMVGGPRQSIMRPSELESHSFHKQLEKAALFGEPSIFDTREGTDVEVEGHTLTLRQESGYMTLSEDGSILLVLPLEREKGRGSLDVIIEEDVAEAILTALQFASQILQSIDDADRLAWITIAAGIVSPPHGEWRTRAEHDRKPNSMQMSRMVDDSPVREVLSPPVRPRAALRQQAEIMAQDLMVLLRRFFR